MLMGRKYDVQVQREQASPLAHRSRVARRCVAVAASLAALLSLAACGGGGDSGVTFDIGVVVAGRPVSGVVIQPGGVQTITISAGQSIELDANESVEWTLEVGGSAVTGSNASVYYQGVTITETALNSSRIALDTSSAFFLSAPVPITLTAVSTFDSAEVATVKVLITN
jgi:hypothetical protein